MRVRIVSDDLTGAADAATPFAGRGLSSAVVVEAGSSSPDVAVASVATDSRRCDVECAVAAVRYAATTCLCGQRDRDVVSFKKIDSLLRGNIAAETAVLLRTWDLSLAVVAPAFPAMGRTTFRGVQRVHGRPVSLGENEREGPSTANVRELVDGLPCMVCDAQTDADLDEIVRRFWGRDVLWVGSAGLSAAVARQMTGRATPTRPLSPRADSVLVVAGSPHPVTDAQLRVLGAEDCGQDAERAQDALRRYGLALLRADGGAHWSELVEAAAKVSAGCLMLTGGDTALAVMKRMRVYQLDVVAEVWPGLSLLRIPSFGNWVLMKSGAFGASDTLQRLAQWVKGVEA